MDTPIDRPKDIQRSEDYRQVLEALKQRVTQAQYEALKAVNRELILLYRDIGRIIVEKQEQFGWGEGVVEQIARDLQVEFPGVRGFSRSNVFNMRRFYGKSLKPRPFTGCGEMRIRLLIGSPFAILRHGLSHDRNSLEATFS